MKVRILSALIIAATMVVAPFARAQTASTDSSSFGRIEAAIAARDSAGKLLQAHADESAATLYLRSAGLVPDLVRPGWTFFETAGALARAGKSSAAAEALDSAVAHGFHDIVGLRADSALALLLQGSDEQHILTAVRDNDSRYRAERSDPATAHVITEDIARFWRAFDLAEEQESTAARAAVFKREYLVPGSAGLLDFYRMKIISPTRLAETVSQFPRFYQSIRQPTLALSGLEPEIRQVFHQMKELYPDAIYPDLYFVIGRISSAGTSTDDGLLFGAEQNVSSASTVLDELPESRRRIVFARSELPHVIAHELIHFQQQLGDKHTLLDLALIEGGATFISQLLLPNDNVPYFMTWGAAHEQEIWSRFASEMNGDGLTDWIGNNTTARETWPADLGYFVGYQITRSYYDGMPDKKKALSDLIRLEDAKEILRLSGYADRFGR